MAFGLDILAAELAPHDHYPGGGGDAVGAPRWWTGGVRRGVLGESSVATHV